MNSNAAQKPPVETASGNMPFHGLQSDADDEISLVDLWLLVRRRWTWLLVGFVSGVSVAIAYATLATPIYESNASIHIGKVSDMGLIEDPDVLTAQLIDQYGLESGDGAKKRMPHLKEATKARRQDNILRLVTVGHSPEEATDFLEQIVAKLIQRHERIYANAVDPLRQRLAAIDGEIRLLAARAGELDDLIDRLKVSDLGQAALAAIERGRLYSELNQLASDRVLLQQRTAQPSSNPSEVIVRVRLPDAPVAPRKKIAIAIGIVLGLMLGLFAVFFKEFIANVQAATRSSKTCNS